MRYWTVIFMASNSEIMIPHTTTVHDSGL